MTIRATTIITIPAGKYRPMFNPDLKDVFDQRDAILAKYQISADLSSYQTADNTDGTRTTTMVSYYHTVEDYDKCLAELLEFRKNQPFTKMGEHTGLSRKYKLVNTQTNETVRDWTELGF
jgi:hypothetical protein